MGSRSVNDMSVRLFESYAKFDQKMKEKGILYILTCTSRNVLEQMALYVQGRIPLDDVNKFRACAGLPSITSSENIKVTWTLDSKHVTNKFDVDLNNDDSRAFDIAILKGGKPVWDLKTNVNENEIPDYDEAGLIGESVGLKWGGRFKNPDRPHFEI